MAKQRREEIRLMAMSRILSHISVYPVATPSPHHSASPYINEGVMRFEDMERVDYRHQDREMERIYDAEYGVETDRHALKRGKKRRVKKEELIKSLPKKHEKSRIDVL